MSISIQSIVFTNSVNYTCLTKPALKNNITKTKCHKIDNYLKKRKLFLQWKKILLKRKKEIAKYSTFYSQWLIFLKNQYLPSLPYLKPIELILIMK